MLDLAAPPGSVQLVSGLGDIGGFVHTDITKAPSAYSATAPFMGSVNGTDFAEKTPPPWSGSAPATPAASHISVSTSSGSSWWAGQEPSGVTGGGTVAVSADGSRIVWSAGRRRRAHVVDARLELDEVDRASPPAHASRPTASTR